MEHTIRVTANGEAACLILKDQTVDFQKESSSKHMQIDAHYAVTSRKLVTADSRMVNGQLIIQPTEMKRLFFPPNKATIIETAVIGFDVYGIGSVKLRGERVHYTFTGLYRGRIASSWACNRSAHSRTIINSRKSSISLINDSDSVGMNQSVKSRS